MRRRRSKTRSQTLNLQQHEVLCRSARVEELALLADGITGAQIIRLGDEPSAAMRRVADSLEDLGNPSSDLPFTFAIHALEDACNEALTGDMHVPAGRVPGSSILVLAFAPVALRACIAAIKGQTS